MAKLSALTANTEVYLSEKMLGGNPKAQSPFIVLGYNHFGKKEVSLLRKYPLKVAGSDINDSTGAYVLQWMDHHFNTTWWDPYADFWFFDYKNSFPDYIQRAMVDILIDEVPIPITFNDYRRLPVQLNSNGDWGTLPIYGSAELTGYGNTGQWNGNGTASPTTTKGRAYQRNYPGIFIPSHIELGLPYPSYSSGWAGEWWTANGTKICDLTRTLIDTESYPLLTRDVQYYIPSDNRYPSTVSGYIPYGSSTSSGGGTANTRALVACNPCICLSGSLMVSDSNIVYNGSAVESYRRINGVWYRTD